MWELELIAWFILLVPAIVRQEKALFPCCGGSGNSYLGVIGTMNFPPTSVQLLFAKRRTECLTKWGCLILASMCKSGGLVEPNNAVELSRTESLIAKPDEFSNALVDGPLLNTQSESYDTAGAETGFQWLSRFQNKCELTSYQRSGRKMLGWVFCRQAPVQSP